MDIRTMQVDAHQTAIDKGWWDSTRPVPECLMLIVTEVAEAMEAYREDQPLTWYGDDGKPEGISSELADIVIRCGDLASSLGINLDMAVGIKMHYNDSRPYRHGGKLA